jgi:phage terminase small subunit|tara:strand:+ start:67 stop:594 length:528 start_codon:yes stop_codon:yes gene_type:complete
MVAPKVTHKKQLEVVANPKREKGLTKIQEKFAMLYATRDDLTQSQCAVEAGYSNRSAHSKASELLNPKRWPNVTRRIREIKEELGRKYEVNFENHVRKLAELRDEAMQAGNFAAAINAEKFRGQAAGIYIDRKEIMHGKIDQMNREEVMRAIQDMQKDYPALKEITADYKVLTSE